MYLKFFEVYGELRMLERNDKVDRRTTLKQISGSAFAGGVLGLSGCLESGSDGDGDGSSDGDGDGDGDGGSDGDGDGGSDGDGDSGDTGNITAGIQFSEQNHNSKVLARALENFSEKTNGRYEVNVKYQSVGGASDHIEAVSGGTIDVFYALPTQITNAYVPEYGFLSTPFVTEGKEHLANVFDKYVNGTEEDSKEGLNGPLIKNGNVMCYGFSYRGDRGTTSNFAVKGPEDIEGFKLRLPQFDTWIAAWEALGAEPVPLSPDELYGALETGLVDGSEGEIVQFVDFSLYEVQSHFSETQHFHMGMTWITNYDMWSSLSDEDKALWKESIDEAAEWGNNELDKSFEEAYATAKEEGTEIVRKEDIDIEGLREKVRPAMKEWFEDKWAISMEEYLQLAE
jgi:TRAP-type C4-dicarboxylate transport system substrate-binding protein